MHKWTAMTLSTICCVIALGFWEFQQYLLMILFGIACLWFAYVYADKDTRDAQFIARAEQERKALLEKPIETTRKDERDSRLFVPQPLD